MPSLFNRRSRSVSTSRPVPPASNSAHAAAAQAFLASRQSQGNLSASAAAAALRSMSPTPTPVAQVQTKRMLNRQASNASVSSATRGRTRTTLQRSPSSGSMTERTFRSPSPGRAAGGAGIPADAAPPVPRVPNNFMTEDIPPVPRKSHRRSMSLDQFPQRIASPPPPSKAPTASQTTTANSAAALAARRSASLQQLSGAEKSDNRDNRNSYNFSYPRGSRPNSPPPTRSPTIGGDQVPDETRPQGANGITAAEATAIQNSLTKIAGKPVKVKKKRLDHPSAEGSHLQSGLLESRWAPTQQEPTRSKAPSQSDQPVRSKKKKPKNSLTGENTHFPDSPASTEADTQATLSETTQERRAQRAAGVLMKQPSVVREDWEGEQQENEQFSESAVSATAPVAKPASATAPTSTQPKKSAPAANMSRKIEDLTKTPIHNSTAPTSQHSATQNLTPNTVDAQSTRQSSISPSRSFRFSDRLASDLTAGRKHEPMGRSISPAKSALKHQSPSRKNTSPTDGTFPHRRGSSVTPSESSEVSHEGTTRKKSVKVSFEASPEVVEISTEPEPTSRSRKDASKKSWFGLGKTKSSPLSSVANGDELDEADEGMKPRPALPSFGSVRKNRQNDTSPSPASRKPTVAASASSVSLSDGSSNAEIGLTETSVSSDHAIGRVLSFEKQAGRTEPVPPEVTTVEGTGYVSDTDSLSSDEEADGSSTSPNQHLSREAGITPQPSGRDLVNIEETAIPAIAVQPATPGLDASAPVEEWIGSVPGGFPGADENGKNSTDRHSSDRSEPAAGLGLGNATASESVVLPTSETDQHQLNPIAEESSDNDSVYSDAASDLSDLDGDGFGSINAIVESPMVASSPVNRLADIPESPTESIEDEAAAKEQSASWNKSQAYWSNVSQQLRNSTTNPQGLSDTEDVGRTQHVNNEIPLVSNATLQPAVEIEETPKAKEQEALPTISEKRIEKPRKSAVANQTGKHQPVPSLKASVDVPEIPERSPSRLSNQPNLRYSMVEQTNNTPKLRERPRSIAAPPTQSLAQPRVVSQKAATPKSPPRVPLQRNFSNDSDSDSSFKRTRTKKPPGSGFARRSMRGGPAETSRPQIAPGRSDIRSLSPPANRQPSAGFAGPRMRMSMRGSQDVSGPTLRGQSDGKKSSFFGKSNKAKSPTRMTSTFGLKSKSQSRFADSDDEDEPRATVYRSRFADSSDEDEVEPMRPVRGIPRRNDEGDSTDLDDSSDDQRSKAKPATPKKLAIQSPSIASPVLSEQMSPATAKKKGFWGRLRGGKKEKENDTTAAVPEQNHGAPVNGDSINATQLGFNNAAERDALVEQTLRKLEASRAEPASPSSPRLQRRATPQRILSDSWPLAPKTNENADNRPVTSAGPGAPSRPALGERLPTSDTVRTAGGTVVYGRNGKKKKFPRLRKAFGLTD